MSAYFPPLYSFTGLDFNPTIFETTSTFTQDQANTLYLQKTVADTATAVETFNAGIITQNVDSGSNLFIGQNTPGTLYLGGSLFDTYLIGSNVYSNSMNCPLFITNEIQSSSSTLQIATSGFTSTILIGTALSTLENYGTTIFDGLVTCMSDITMPTKSASDNSTFGATTAYVTSAFSNFLTTAHTWTATQTFSSIVSPILNYAGLLTIGASSTGINIGTGTTSTINITGTTISLIGQARTNTLVLTSATTPSIDTSIGTTLLIGGTTASGINLGKSTSTVAIQGNITMPTKIASDNSTFGATTAYVTSAISALSSIYQTAAQVTTAITSYGYQTAAQVTTAITSYGYQTAANVTTAITNLKSANNTWSGTNNFTNFLSINSNSVMSIKGTTTTQIVILGSALSSTAGVTVSFGQTFNVAPYVFLTNINVNAQGVSANSITTTNFKLYSSVGTPTVQWMAIGN